VNFKETRAVLNAIHKIDINLYELRAANVIRNFEFKTNPTDDELEELFEDLAESLRWDEYVSNDMTGKNDLKYFLEKKICKEKGKAE